MVDGDDVEPAGVSAPAGVLLQEVFGGGGQALTLARVHTFQRSSPGVMPAGANFDEYYCIAVQHDQIELAAAARPVLRHQAQSMLFEVGAGAGFRLAPGLLGGAVADQIPLFSSGCTWPFLNSAQGRWRSTRWLAFTLRVPVRPSTCMLGTALSSGRRGASW